MKVFKRILHALTGHNDDAYVGDGLSRGHHSVDVWYCTTCGRYLQHHVGSSFEHVNMSDEEKRGWRLRAALSDKEYLSARVAELEQELKETRYAFELVTVQLDERHEKTRAQSL